jgi:DNA-binding transcriptional regulator YhcF (GntR family)
MNYNFEESVRKSLARAREDAVRLRHDYVGTEHLLLGLLRDGSMRSLFKRLGVDPEGAKAAVEGAVRPGNFTVSVGELPYTGRAKKVLELTLSEARERKAPTVTTEHLLYGLLKEEQGIAAQVLTQLGVTAARIAAAPVEEPVGESAGFRIRIDDASDRSIYEQIVSGVTEAVATGELRPGGRLPTVRQLADELDVAPGTVARAYSELERRGVVVTEGARGTRVAERDRSTLSALDRPETLVGLLRPVAVAGFHLGATAAELRAALDEAMRGIFDKQDHAA